jgi:hypothetical protein
LSREQAAHIRQELEHRIAYHLDFHTSPPYPLSPIVSFQTPFENKKAAVETVTPMLDTDGQWRVSGYYIR